MRYEVSYVDVWSLGRVVALVYAARGLISWLFVPFFLFFGLTGIQGAGWGWAFSIGFMLFIPVINGLMGLLVGAIAGAVYNLVARSMGGLEVALTARAPLDGEVG